MNPRAPHTLTLHRFHAKELDANEAERVRQAIERDPEVRRRYQAILAADAEVQASALPPRLAELRSTPRRSWTIPALGAIGVLAAVSLAIAVPATLRPATEPEALYVGLKGELPDLEIWIGTEAGPRLLRPGEPVGPGDTVQLAVRAPEADFVTLVGDDGGGSIEIYGTLTIEGEGMQVAPFALQLQGPAGKTQRFFALPHDEVLDDAQVRDAFEQRPEDWRVLELPLVEGAR